MKKCDYCGGENTDGATNCVKCGMNGFKAPAVEAIALPKIESLVLPPQKGNHCKKRITELSVFQTSWIAGLIGAALGVLGGLAAFAVSGNFIFIFLSPICYCLGCLFSAAISAFLYNALAKRMGGIEFIVESEPFTTTVPLSALFFPPPPPRSLEDELRQVTRLKAEGLITEDEFNQKRKAILGL